MNIKQFLLDNYIWILVVLLLLIITIIGFLADKKRGSKKKQNAESNQTGPMPLNNDVPQAPINYQPTPEQQQMVNPTNANAQMPINQNMNLGNNGFNPNQNNPVDFGTVPNMPVTPMNINNNVPNNDLNMMNPLNNQVTEPMPLNEPINSIKGPFEQNDNNQLNGFTQPMENNMNQFTNPQPTENLNQMVNQNSEPMYQPLEEQKPTFAPKEVNIPSINDINNIQPQSMNNAFDNAMNQSQPSMINNQNMNIQPDGALNQAPMMEAQSQQMMQPTPMPNMEQNTIPNPITPPQPVNPQPVNFVYGPQQPNNNQFM